MKSYFFRNLEFLFLKSLYEKLYIIFNKMKLILLDNMLYIHYYTKDLHKILHKDDKNM
jgi:hypothetical protein